jgi:hypothetical protein
MYRQRGLLCTPQNFAGSLKSLRIIFFGTKVKVFDGKKTQKALGYYQSLGISRYITTSGTIRIISTRQM